MTTQSIPSDLDIAQAATLQPIWEIAEKMGLAREDIELYGDHMAKIKLETIDKLKDRPNARYILVTAITPTPLGEGKSTTTVGLGQGLHHVGKTATIAIHRRDRPLASKAARLAAATARWCRWSSSICT
jgi:formate--tetrahydrofolate ligase